MEGQKNETKVFIFYITPFGRVDAPLLRGEKLCRSCEHDPIVAVATVVPAPSTIILSE